MLLKQIFLLNALNYDKNATYLIPYLWYVLGCIPLLLIPRPAVTSSVLLLGLSVLIQTSFHNFLTKPSFCVCCFICIFLILFENIFVKQPFQRICFFIILSIIFNYTHHIISRQCQNKKTDIK